MVVRMRSTRSHTGNRRSHHALSSPALSMDKKGGDLHLRHRASSVTGMYKGIVVKSLEKKIARNLKRQEEKSRQETKKS